MRRRSDKRRKRNLRKDGPAPNESAGQRLSPEEQEKAALKRILSEMRPRRGDVRV
jgi:hypothetical protein